MEKEITPPQVTMTPGDMGMLPTQVNMMSTLTQVNTFTIRNSVGTLNKQRVSVNSQLLLRCLERTGIFFNGKQTPFFELFSLNGSVCITDMDGIKRLGIDMGGGKDQFQTAATQ